MSTDHPETPPALARQMPARRSGRTPAADAPDRKRAILLAAEKLFGQHGYASVSIRDIAQEAGVPVALLNYHFGAKHELYHAIFESWAPMIATRLQQLQAVATDLQAPDALERVLAAWLYPLLDLAQHPEGRHYAWMAARDMASPSPESERAQREFFDGMARAFIGILMQLFPHASRLQVVRCYQTMLGAVLMHLMADARLRRLADLPADADLPDDRDLLLRQLAAGYRGALG